MPRSNLPRSRNFVFTLNNYTPELELSVQTNCVGICKYLVYGKEIAESGTHHLQGLVCFKNAKTRAAAKRFCGGRTSSLQVMKGTFKQASDYCKKEQRFIWVYGELPSDPKEKGAKSKARWTAIVKMAKAANWEAMADEYPQEFVCQYNKMKLIAKDFEKKLEPLVSEFRNPTGDRNVWIQGPTGVGKTYAAKAYGDDFYKKNLNKWWDHYRGQANVIIDEVCPKQDWIGSFLKIWAQEDPFIAEVKGGSRTIRPKRIIVTSQYSIGEIFTDPLVVEALKGRFFVREILTKTY